MMSRAGSLPCSGSWAIDLVPGDISRRAAFDGVIDLNGLNELVGVEILDFRWQTGAAIPRLIGPALPKCGYDEEIDALYVHVAIGNAPIQIKAKGVVVLDADNQMLGLTVTPLTISEEKTVRRGRCAGR